MSYLEIACFSPISALTALAAGASRVELCTSYAAGGLTPPPPTLFSIKPAITIPIFVMIRPRAGNFVYSTPEYAQMQNEIAAFKDLADGFVFGMLTADGRVDAERCRALVELAAPAPCTFHRAIDEVPRAGLWEAVEEVVACGFKALLTSGGERDAVVGAEVLAGLRERFEGRIEVVIGGGVRSGNVRGLRNRAGEGWFHSAAIVGEGEEADVGEVRRLVEALR